MSGGLGWIGVDLDGTLAHYDVWHGPEHVGKPIASMVDRIRLWLAGGMEVKIFTARVSEDPKNAVPIQDWLEAQCSLPRLEVTCRKDFRMLELWDDRAVQVWPNSGIRADGLGWSDRHG